MKKEIKKSRNSSEDLEEKLDKIIEQSRTENDALKKILQGLEKMEVTPEKKRRKIKLRR